MKYKINNEEQDAIIAFQSLSIPNIFKTDDTDFILFVEEVNFTVCEMLLKGKEITQELYEWIVNDSNNGDCPCLNDFLKVNNKFHVDKYSKQYCEQILDIMHIFQKYYS